MAKQMWVKVSTRGKDLPGEISCRYTIPATQEEIDEAAGVADLRAELSAVTEQRDKLLEAVDKILIPPEHDSKGYLGQAAEVVYDCAYGEELLWRALEEEEINLTATVTAIKAASAAGGDK
jgi:hypothetical protein